MGNAELNGSGGWPEINADMYKGFVLTSVRELARDTARLAKEEKGSAAAVLLRDRIEDHWRTINRDLELMRVEERRETKLIARDLLHARLSSFYQIAMDSKTETPLINWHTAFKGAMLWLARWSGRPG